jgi:quinol monooxygenase YgiN
MRPLWRRCSTRCSAQPARGRMLSIHAFRSIRDARLCYIHSPWTGEESFDAHATLRRTVRFIERTGALVDQPIEVTRPELIG